MKTDLRITRTKALIRDAFIRLIEQKGYNAITVRDIANEAMINRGTFYLHYTDKHDLLAKTTDEVLQELISKIQPKRHIEGDTLSISSLRSTMETLLESINKHASFYRAMLGENGTHDFHSKIKDVVKQKFTEEFNQIGLQNESISVPKDLLINYVVSAYIGVITWWLEGGLTYSPHYIASKLAELVTHGPFQALGLKVKE